MTAQERQAIGFLLAVTLLGTGVRVVRARSERVQAPASDSLALDRQIDAVDSALATRSVRKGRGNRRRQTSARDEPAAEAPHRTAEIDISAIPERRDGTSKTREAGRNARVDLDVAGKAEIEALPWVGPALAERILEHREACGPFGSMDALEAVPGVGKRTAERLSEHVTFSGRQRPSSIVPQRCQTTGTSPGGGARKRRP